MPPSLMDSIRNWTYTPAYIPLVVLSHMVCLMVREAEKYSILIPTLHPTQEAITRVKIRSFITK